MGVVIAAKQATGTSDARSHASATADGGHQDGAPRTLGRYRIGERLGLGGTAEVFRAEVEGASGFSKALVVKCLRPALADEPELVEGLAREARLAQRLHHGNIVQVLDFGVEHGRPYVVMEHVDGGSLHELLADLRRRGERMGLGEALFVVEEVAAALRYAHGLTDDHGVPLRLVHRDVKPRNVLVSREGVVKLADFGIAKLADDGGDTLPGVIKGTPRWLAPEQALGRGVDARTDVYALGLLLRELVGDDASDGVDGSLRDVWRKATADAPEDRFADVQAMLRALQRWRAAHELDAGPGQLPAWVRRARQQAPIVKPLALDAALLGEREHDVTVTSTPPGATPTPRHDAAPRRRRSWIILSVAFVLGGGSVAMWLDETRRSEPQEAARSAGVHPEEPARAHDGAPDSRARNSGTAETSGSAPTSPTPTRDPKASDPSVRGPASSDASGSAYRELDASVSDSSAAPSRTREAASSAHRRAPQPTAELGRLRINVLPWAEVTVDGRALGRVPVDVELPPGRHRVRLENPQLGEHNLEIELAAGGVQTISRW